MKAPTLFLLITLLFLFSCENTDTPTTNIPIIPARHTGDEFAKYWYAGKAEVASYELSQSRYGQQRPGKAVLIFVTEPFSEKKQVKLDDPSTPGAVTVMKMNQTRNFITGIYPYSMMLSAFTPVSADKYPHTLKVTMSSQEWCGQAFSQFNLDGKKYDINGFSYFETESDWNSRLSATILEDELFNRIRLNPEMLPVGQIQIIPSSFHNRLRHIPFSTYSANATLTEENDEILSYKVQYSDLGRKVEIQFEKQFPYQIIGWSETDTDSQGKEHTTTATFLAVLHTPYWKQNALEFEYLRDSLKLNN